MYFDSGMKTDVTTLKNEFRSAEGEGREAWTKQSSVIDAKRKETNERLAALQADLDSGKLTRADYETKVSSLV
jgi:hypothetical protein